MIWNKSPRCTPKAYIGISLIQIVYQKSPKIVKDDFHQEMTNILNLQRAWEEYEITKQGKRFYNLRGIKIDPAGGIPDALTSYDTVPVTRSTISVSGLFALVKEYDNEYILKFINIKLMLIDNKNTWSTNDRSFEKSEVALSINLVFNK